MSSIIRRKTRFHPFLQFENTIQFWAITTHVSREKKQSYCWFLPKIRPPNLWGLWNLGQNSWDNLTHRIHVWCIFTYMNGWFFMVNCRCIFTYIYHKKSTIHVGKYTIVPWILWVLHIFTQFNFRWEANLIRKLQKKIRPFKMRLQAPSNLHPLPPRNPTETETL